MPENPNAGKTMGDVPVGLIPRNAESLDPVLILLFVGMLIFVCLLFVVQTWWPNDGQLFQVIAGVLTAFTGSFFTRLKPRTPGAGEGARAPE